MRFAERSSPRRTIRLRACVFRRLSRSAGSTRRLPHRRWRRFCAGTGPAERVASVRLLGFGPFAIAAEPLAALLSPRQPPELQSAAVRALAAQDQSRTVELLLAGWDSYGPSLRREVVEAVLARPGRV